ncbi:SpoIIE family protein phosphatase [Streptomyces sp. NPDC059454]|uniref:SpoIIE family protein phosphatase n=1 Tax=Streptomyces sp. NPDC059454 TaxID=3346836 RepID=UPI00369D81E9
MVFPRLPVSPPLGPGAALPFEAAEPTLSEGSKLVLHTDGLIHDRSHYRDPDTGLEAPRAAPTASRRPSARGTARRPDRARPHPGGRLHGGDRGHAARPAERRHRVARGPHASPRPLGLRRVGPRPAGGRRCASVRRSPVCRAVRGLGTTLSGYLVTRVRPVPRRAATGDGEETGRVLSP